MVIPILITSNTISAPIEKGGGYGAILDLGCQSFRHSIIQSVSPSYFSF